MDSLGSGFGSCDSHYRRNAVSAWEMPLRHAGFPITALSLLATVAGYGLQLSGMVSIRRPQHKLAGLLSTDRNTVFFYRR